MALDAGGFGRVEDGLTAADIPGGQLGADLFEALPATGQSGVERLEEAVALGADFGGIALEGGSQRFRPDRSSGLGLAQSAQQGLTGVGTGLAFKGGQHPVEFQRADLRQCAGDLVEVMGFEGGLGESFGGRTLSVPQAREQKREVGVVGGPAAGQRREGRESQRRGQCLSTCGFQQGLAEGWLAVEGPGCAEDR